MSKLILTYCWKWKYDSDSSYNDELLRTPYVGESVKAF